MTTSTSTSFFLTRMGTVGDDSLIIGSNEVVFGNVALYGFAGNDGLEGNFGDDLLDGGSGNDGFSDRLYYDLNHPVTSGNDAFLGGAGIDSLYVVTYGTSASYVLDLDETSPQNTGSLGVDTVTGIENVIANGNVGSLSGTKAANWLESSHANLYGRGGDDVLVITGDVDLITIDGGDGIDTLLLGERGYFSSATGYTFSLAPGASPSGLTITSINNLGGGSGDDKLTGDDNINILAGADGSDVLIGAGGNDVLAGDGNWIMARGDITSNSFFEVVERRNGDDVLEGGLGDDRLIGGGGTDTASYARAAGSVTVDLSAGTTSGADGGDTLSSIENVVGSAYADSLSGTDGNNVLDGGQGNDTLSGGLGNDTYFVSSKGDTIVEQAHGGTDTVISSISYVLGELLERLVLVGTADLNATGNALSNVLTGNAGINRLTGGLGNDTYVIQNVGDRVVEKAGEGQDTVSVSFDYALGANLEGLTLADGAVRGIGNTLDNVILGNAAGNTIDGGRGADTMSGKGGDDTYLVDNAKDVVIEQGAGVDTVIASTSWTMTSLWIENLTLVGTAIAGKGSNTVNTIRGNDLDNVIDGGGNADVMIGGKGNDTYYVDQPSDQIIEQAGEGVDRVLVTAGSYVLSANVENGLALGNTNIILSGNALDNRLTGNETNNLLDGKAGTDTLLGGKGDDVYVIGDTTDVIIERAGEGKDAVRATSDYTLSANLEELELFGQAVRGTGNAGTNQIWGNALDNVIDGKAGADTMHGGDGADAYYVDNAGDRVVEEGSDIDTITATVDYSLDVAPMVEVLKLAGAAIGAHGSGRDDTLIGNDRANTLDGSFGSDTMIGGKGDDQYWIDNAGDTVTEKAGEGTDTVHTVRSYTLESSVENLVCDNLGFNGSSGGPVSVTLTGNELDNHITSKIGGAILDGGAGADTLVSAETFNTFIVDNIGDRVSGFGLVKASVSFTLEGTLDLELTGTAQIDGTGNSGSNRITGNDAANVLLGLDGQDLLKGMGGDDLLRGGSEDDVLDGGVGQDRLEGGDGNDLLDGGSGGDTLVGGAGDDRYVVDSAADVILETANGGLDRASVSISATLAANVEVGVVQGQGAITLTGGATDNLLGGNEFTNTLNGGDGNDTLFGQAGNDTLAGGNGADTLYGGIGVDTLTGGAGSDSFIISTLPNEGVDRIADFVSGVDRVVVINPILTGILLSGGFVNGTSAHDGDDIAIYDRASGNLYADFDANGPQGKVLIASFAPGTALAASDIQLINDYDFASQTAEAQGLLLF